MAGSKSGLKSFLVSPASSTDIFVTSLPVPHVVGTAIIREQLYLVIFIIQLHCADIVYRKHSDTLCRIHRAAAANRHDKIKPQRA